MDKQKETILIAHNYSQKSFSAMSYSLAHYLANKGYKVVFISYRPFFKDVQKIQIGLGEIIVLSWHSKKRPTSFKDLVWFIKIFLKYKPKIVIAHFAATNIIGIVSKIISLGNVKTIFYFHSLFVQFESKSTRNIKFYLSTIRKKIFYTLFCDQIICPSEFGKFYVKKIFNFKNVIVLLNPIPDRLNNIERLPSNSIVISYLGRLEIDKGINDLINAFNIYKKKYINTRIIINIAGVGSQKEFVLEQIKNNNAIHFFDELSYEKVDNYLINSNYTIIPSKIDNLPTVGIESLMNSIPLLISNKTGLTGYLTNNIDCYIFNPDIESIIKIFEKVETNATNFNQMKSNARKAYENLFTIDHYNIKMEKLINNYLR